MSKLYRQVELSDEDYYDFVYPHVLAMAGEKLHSKAEIAEELGIRDTRIAELEKRLKEADEWLSIAYRQGVEDGEEVANRGGDL